MRCMSRTRALRQYMVLIQNRSVGLQRCIVQGRHYTLANDANIGLLDGVLIPVYDFIGPIG